MRNHPKKRATCPVCRKDFTSTFRERSGKKCWKTYCSQRCVIIVIGPKGPTHHLWKERPAYLTLHDWVKRHATIPPACEHCGRTRKLDAANISKEYKRDLSDWKFLCKKCHVAFDGNMNHRNADGTFAPVPHRNPYVRYPPDWLKKKGLL